MVRLTFNAKQQSKIQDMMQKNEEGKVYNHFGSLNQSGGENRLNVGVTCAKEGIIVISSIEPEDLNVGNTSERGSKLLKSYLKYESAVFGGKIEGNHTMIQEINEAVTLSNKLFILIPHLKSK
ncbi:hypothetical protein [Niallia taxi]|uniref:hypothetical protein n=1 Tax=Niallia taxi TaxID=2499688 RepID=UPI0030096D63